MPHKEKIQSNRSAFLRLPALSLTIGGILILSLVSTLIFVAKPNWFSPFDEQGSHQENEENFEYSSLSTGRTTELSKATKKKSKPGEEWNLMMNDPSMSQKWGLALTNSPKAWQKLKTRGEGVVIAIIDTGIDVRHPDLQNNLFVNTGEVGFDKNGKNKATNNIDDDHNGKVDDVHGWNFVNDNNNLTDNHGHGTHIAGIIAAEGGNGQGVSGVAPRAQILALKYYDPNAPGVNNLKNTVRAIEYVISLKQKLKIPKLIINYSGGGLEPSAEEKRAVDLARKNGILFIAAAGNERSNSDQKPYYPADYSLPNIISVTAIDRERNVLPSSNFGARSVDLAAPGNDIYSTLPNGQYGFMTGTSQATAFVTGVAALIMSYNSDFKPDHVRNYLTKTGDFDPKLDGKTIYRKRLNTYNALVTLDQGVGLTGVIAENSVNMNRFQFSSDPQALKNEIESKRPDGQIVFSGRAIMQKIGNPKQVRLLSN